MIKNKKTYLQIHPDDNVLVALQDLSQGTIIEWNNRSFALLEHVAAKHKFTIYPLAKDDEIYMYGVLVGKVNCDLETGALISTLNLRHAADDFKLSKRNTSWTKPDVSIFKDRTFNGFHRSNGTVGTANYWVVIPLVFVKIEMF